MPLVNGARVAERITSSSSGSGFKRNGSNPERRGTGESITMASDGALTDDALVGG